MTRGYVRDDASSLHRCARSSCGRTVADGSELSRVCEGCRREGLNRVVALPQRWLTLRQALVPGVVSGDERLSHAKPGSRPPLSSIALEAVEAVELYAARLDLTLRQLVGQRPLSYGRIRRTTLLSGCVELASRAWPRLMRSPAAVEVLDELDRLWRRTDVLLGLDDVVHRLAAPCPSCSLVTLTRRNGDDRVRCIVCGSSWPEAQYQHLVRVLAAELADDPRASAGSSS